MDKFWEENGYRYYSIDESLFVHDINKTPLWILCMTDNHRKDFRVVVSKSPSQEATKKFITRYIPKGNNIVTHNWSSYEWIDHRKFWLYPLRTKL